MKKIIVLITILSIILYNFDIKATNIKNIDLKIKEGETNIVFLKLKGSTSLLITDEDTANLFIIDYKNDSKIKESLEIFNSHPNIYFLKENLDTTISNVHVFKKNNQLKFRVNNYTLCIFSSKTHLNTCDFIYIRKIEEDIESLDKFSAIFYDEDIKDEKLRFIEESWVDNAIVSTDSFTILKLYEDSYNILIVPSTNN